VWNLPGGRRGDAKT